MKIAIHNAENGFHPRWVKYCEEIGVKYKLVNCYDNDILEQLKDCDALMWHFSQSNSKDVLFAKQLLFSLDQAGKIVFPNFNTAWHFDDKLGQKYLFEALDVPKVNTHAFYEKDKALNWIETQKFPLVLKLRSGAGSENVKLIRNLDQGKKAVKKAFGSGFEQYDPLSNLKEKWRKYKLGKLGVIDLIKGLARFFIKPNYAKVMGNERGYILFQDFMPNNDCDIRIIIINNKAFGLKRMVRENDFRASGSGNFRFKREEFDERCVSISFEVANKMKSDSAAFDFIFDQSNNPLLVEVSYGFVKEVYYPCEGYWDEQLNWFPGEFNSQAWMVDTLISRIKEKTA
jgi:glutathione synthase/RimK-type ligase-like ATP-grasp enzyme